MTTDSAVAAKVDPAEAARVRANPSGIVLKDDHALVAWYYAVCGVILIAAGIVIPMTVDDGPWLAVMSVLGSVIIIALMSAAALPHLKRAHR